MPGGLSPIEPLHAIGADKKQDHYMNQPRLFAGKLVTAFTSTGRYFRAD